MAGLLQALDAQVAAFVAGERFFSASPDPLAAVDRDGAVRAVNAAWTAMLSTPDSEWRAPPSLIDAAAAHQRYELRAFLQRPADSMTVVEIADADGGPRSVHLRILYSEAGDLVCLRARDIGVERRGADLLSAVERATGIGAWEIDPASMALRWSPQTFRVHALPWPGAAPSLEAALAFFPEPGRRTYADALDRLIEDGAPFDMELPFRDAREADKWVRLRAAATEGRDGARRLQGVIEDVTAARAEREQLAQAAAVAANTPAAAMVFDADRRITWVNPAFQKLTGYTLEEARGRTPGDLLNAPDVDPEIIAEARARVMEGKATRLRAPNVRKDGARYWLDAEIDPILGDDGAVTGFTAMMRDITEERAAADWLEAARDEACEARRVLHDAVEALDDAFALYDADDRLVICNRRFRETYPVTAPMIQPGARYEDLLRYGLENGEYDVPPERREAWIEELLRQRRAGGLNRKQQLRDGRWVRVRERRTPDGGVVGLRIDVTELQRERMRLSDVLDATGIGTWQECLTTGRVDVNARWADMLGYDARDIQPLDAAFVRAMIHPEDLPAVMAARRAHLTGDADAFHCEFRMQGKAGWRWIVSRGRVVSRDDAGRPLTMAGMHQDVTDQRANADRLRAAQEAALTARRTLQEAIETLPDAFMLFDADDRLVVCNRPYRDMFPKTAESAVPGVKFQDLLRLRIEHGEIPRPEGDLESWIADRLPRLRARGGHNEEVQLPNGRWIRRIDRPTPDGGVAGMRIDITEIKRQGQRLADIIDATNVGTFEVCLTTDRVVINEQFARMLGFSRQALEPMTRFKYRSMIHPEDRARMIALRDAHVDGLTPHFLSDLRFRTADGWRWVHCSGRVSSRAPDGAPLILMGMHQDITERKAHEAELEAARARAEQAAATKAQFLANMSHEIRTPMNGVLGVAQLLEQRLSDPDHLKLVALMRQSGDALLTVIDDVLDFSKIESGRIALEAAPFKPAELARRVESLHRLKARERGVAFALRLEGALDAPLLGDAHRILQILHNLVGNAVKFTERGAITVTMARAPDGPLTMTVADTGVGMTAEQQALVFEDFVQADSSVTRRFGGTGLGMAITRRLVTLMDGRIDLDSAPGQGTTVRAMLPLAEAPAAPALPRPSANADALQGRHVLIADDNETNRFILKAMLESLGLCVSVAEDGRQAVDMARERRFDAILTDISMPGLDGEGARAQIRADQARAGAPRTPIAAVTAHALTHQVEGFLAAGFDAHVAKPLRVETLRQTLLDLLAAPSGDGDDAAASDRAAGGDG